MVRLKTNVLTPQEKTGIIDKYQLKDKDTGSAEVQIALLTEEINQLTRHLRKHVKDYHSRRGLLQMVIRRKRFLNWLRAENSRRYNLITKKLALRK